MISWYHYRCRRVVDYSSMVAIAVAVTVTMAVAVASV